jgi:hypothetical protein
MATPRIWYTRWMSDAGTDVRFDYVCRGGADSRYAYSDAVRYGRPLDDRHVPEFLHFGVDGDETVKRTCRDAFRIADGVLVCSKAFRDVLMQHDLGSSRLHEVPVRRDATGTPSKLPPHYLLHVTERKVGTFAPRHSTDVRQLLRRDETVPRPHASWAGVDDRDALAVNAAAARGADLWHDPALRQRLFLSDRLKLAIDAAGLSSRAFRFQEARVLR